LAAKIGKASWQVWLTQEDEKKSGFTQKMRGGPPGLVDWSWGVGTPRGMGQSISTACETVTPLEKNKLKAPLGSEGGSPGGRGCRENTKDLMTF